MTWVELLETEGNNYTVHFCGKHHDFELERRVSEKIVTLTTKMCGERRKEEKAVKNRQKCRKMSGGTRLVRKMPKAMLDNTTNGKHINFSQTHNVST